MFANEPRKTWIAIGLLGGSALAFLVRNTASNATLKAQSGQVANVLLLAALLALVWPLRKLNRTLAEIHADIRSGRQPRSTPLQRIGFLLAFALIVLQVYDSFH